MKALTYLVSKFLAQTTTRSLFPFPIHLLLPLMIQPPSTFLALVVNSEASDPISLSVRPHPPINSRSLSLGTHLALYSSEPRVSIV